MPISTVGAEGCRRQRGGGLGRQEAVDGLVPRLTRQRRLESLELALGLRSPEGPETKSQAVGYLDKNGLKVLRKERRGFRQRSDASARGGRVPRWTLYRGVRYAMDWQAGLAGLECLRWSKRSSLSVVSRVVGVSCATPATRGSWASGPVRSCLVRGVPGYAPEHGGREGSRYRLPAPGALVLPSAVCRATLSLQAFPHFHSSSSSTLASSLDHRHKRAYLQWVYIAPW